MRGFSGPFGVFVRSYAFMRAWGPGLREMSEVAVLNANYLLARLRDAYDLPYDRLCMHEFVLSARTMKHEHGITALDVAKRLMDFGFHPPTVYFPLVVPEALMIEPTETEAKETLDAFAEAMLAIAREAASEPDASSRRPMRRRSAGSTRPGPSSSSSCVTRSTRRSSPRPTGAANFAASPTSNHNKREPQCRRGARLLSASGGSGSGWIGRIRPQSCKNPGCATGAGSVVDREVSKQGRTMRQMRIGRRTGIALAVVACAVALATPVALAHRSATPSNGPGNVANGFVVFNNYFCVACHVMKAAGPASYRGYNVCNGDTACNLGMNFNKIHAPYPVAVATATTVCPRHFPSTRPRWSGSARC